MSRPASDLEPLVKRQKLSSNDDASLTTQIATTSSSNCTTKNTSGSVSQQSHQHKHHGCADSSCHSTHHHHSAEQHSSQLSSSSANLTSQSVADSLNPLLPEPNGSVNLSISELPDKGRALFTHQSVSRNQVLLRDEPVGFIQFQSSCRRTLSCHQCGRFIGSLMDQIALLTNGEVRLPSLPNLSEHDAILSLIVECPQHCGLRYCSEQCQSVSWFKHHELLCTGPSSESNESLTGSPHSRSVTRAINQTHRMSFKERLQQKKARHSARQNEARDLDVSRFQILQHFHNHAMRHHQFFTMAAQLVATLVNQQRRGGDIDACLKSLSLFHTKPWWDCVNLGDGLEMPDDIDEIDLDEVSDEEQCSLSALGQSLDDRLVAAAKKQHRSEARQHIISVVQKSFDLLRSALFTLQGLSVPDWLTLEFYSRLVGAMKLNNISVEIRNPLVEYFQSLDALSDSDKLELQTQLAPVIVDIVRCSEETARWQEQQLADAADIEENEESDDEKEEDEDEEESDDDESSDSEDDEAPPRDDESAYPTHVFDWSIPTPSSSQIMPLSFPSTMFPCVQGSALFPTLAIMNHSCLPNVSYAFIDDARGVLVSEQDINVSNVTEPVELCISYTDVDDVPLAERRAALEDYGFVCTCLKCQHEAAAELDT